MAEEQAQQETAGGPEEAATLENTSVGTETPSQDYQELNTRYLRLAADFDNFRKRQAQERESLFKYGAQSTLERLLPILDNLERGQKSLTPQSDPQMLYKSFDMLTTQLMEALKDVGLSKMQPLGQPFNPEEHEAVGQQPDSAHPEHTVIQVYQDGYMLRDKVLRHAQVVVSTEPVGSGPETPFQPAGQESNPFQQATTGAGQLAE